MPKTQLHPMNALFFFALLFLHTHFTICNGVSLLDLNSLKTSELGVVARRVCAGKIGECEEMAEAEMDSESNRRVLVAQKKQTLIAGVVRLSQAVPETLVKSKLDEQRHQQYYESMGVGLVFQHSGTSSGRKVSLQSSL
ncbi:hypothetical protein F0562_035232 [Nyssa sinensis]|uniref:Uncharacterized protein n=1 Tax=Nyssa sinensis TaxID=561372 RepID=A0A5J5ACD7_9ASTE|nr:hypothetical protein F0562_035232 [Nyssa sinensis]